MRNWVCVSRRPLWRDDPIQGTEATFADWNETWRIGFTTTQDDPFGDVVQVDLIGDENELGFSAEPRSLTPVSAESGLAESHLSFSSGSNDSAIEAVYTTAGPFGRRVRRRRSRWLVTAPGGRRIRRHRQQARRSRRVNAGLLA